MVLRHRASEDLRTAAQLDVTIDDRTDFGAMLDRARARIARRLREPGQIVDVEPVRLPEPVPALGVEVDPFS